MYWKGEELPVSVFEGGGYIREHTTHLEKRKIAGNVPVWDPELCS